MDDDFTGQRLAQRKEPIYKSTVPKLGEPDPYSPSELETNMMDEGTEEVEKYWWKIKGDFLVRIRCNL